MTDEIERIPFGPEPASRAVRNQVAKLFEAGELVAIPTETVYGIAARADHDGAIAKLRGVKGRPKSLGFTWHVGSANELERFPSVSALARRLAAKYWPGPLTLVLPGIPDGLEAAAVDGWTGVRLPAFAATASLASELDFPLVATSANRHGAAPLCDAAAIAREFAGELALVLDGGTPPLKEGSVVLKVGRGRFELLRPGIIDLEHLRAAAGLRIGFVCTGNTCRSPMAEALARELTAKRLEVPASRLNEFGFAFRSMGLFAQAGSPAAGHAVELLAARGIDLSEHAASMVESDELERLDRIYALTAGHLDALRSLVDRELAERCELLDPDGRDIADPVGGSMSDYRECASAIESALERRLDEWV